MKIIINIQSISDIITNSSSEVYVINTNMSKTILERLIKNYIDYISVSNPSYTYPNYIKQINARQLEIGWEYWGNCPNIGEWLNNYFGERNVFIIPPEYEEEYDNNYYKTIDTNEIEDKDF